MEIQKQVYTPKIAYKGFNKDLICQNDTQFEIGKVYYKENVPNPKLCSDQGYHYCDKLLDVFKHYSANGSNRFCEIEIMGSFTDDISSYSDGKSITTCFRIVKEISKEEIDKIVKIEEDKKLELKMKLEEVRWLQTKYPTLHVGGSVGLFLHGLHLDRWKISSSSDIDCIIPYYILFESGEDDNFEIDYHDGKASGNDFDETFLMTSSKNATVKVDVFIDNKQRYEIIEYNGFKYKVSQLEKIMEAKIKYALNGQYKHKEDVKELLGATKRNFKFTI